MKTVYVIGVFDLFHTGHLNLLKRSRELGDRLIVAVNSDDLVKKYKRNPFIKEQDRLEIIKSLVYVDEAFIINEYDNRKYILEYNIDIIVHGNDWELESYMKQIRVTNEFLQKHNVTIELIPYTNGISTSDLIKRITNELY